MSLKVWMAAQWLALKMHAAVAVPPLCALTVLAVTRVYSRTLVSCEPDLPLKLACFRFNFWNDLVKARPSIAMTSVDISARLLWHSAVVLTIVMALVATGLCTVIVLRALRDNRTGPGRVLVLITGCALLAALLFSELGTRFITIDFLFRKSRLFDSELPLLIQIVQVTRRAITFAGVFVIAAAAATLDERHTGDELAELSQRLRDLNLVLYLGAGLLVTALIEFASFQSIAIAMVNPDKRALVTVLSKTANAATASSGMIYATALAALYIPALAVLQFKINRLYMAYRQMVSANGEQRPLPRAKWLAEHELSATTPSLLIRWIAVLSPLVAASPLAALLKLVR